MTKVVIDPGHGGSDPGACYGEWREADFAWAIADALYRMVKPSKRIQALMTRPPHAGVSLQGRVRQANDWDAHIFLSIHLNAAPLGANRTEAAGSEVWHFPGSTQGARLAEALGAGLIAEFPFGGYRGEKSAADFFVLKGTRMPAALVEVGFITNPATMALLQREDEQEAVAFGLLSGILAL